MLAVAITDGVYEGKKEALPEQMDIPPPAIDNISGGISVGVMSQPMTDNEQQTGIEGQIESKKKGRQKSKSKSKSKSEQPAMEGGAAAQKCCVVM